MSCDSNSPCIYLFLCSSSFVNYCLCFSSVPSVRMYADYIVCTRYLLVLLFNTFRGRKWCYIDGMVEIATRTVAFFDFVLGSVSFSSHRVFSFDPIAAIAYSITGSHFLDYRTPCEWVHKEFVRCVSVELMFWAFSVTFHKIITNVFHYELFLSATESESLRLV